MAGLVCRKCGEIIKSGEKIIYEEEKPIHYPRCPESPRLSEREIPLNMFLVWKAFAESAKECASTLGVTVYDKVYMPKIAECVAHRMKGMTADIIKSQHPEWVEEYEKMMKGSGAPDLYTDEINERSLHKCWFGEHEFSLNDAKFCETCQTYKCPICGGCYCNLSSEAKEALDAEMFTLGLWKPYGQPCRRKRRR